MEQQLSPVEQAYRELINSLMTENVYLRARVIELEQAQKVEMERKEEYWTGLQNICPSWYTGRSRVH